MDAAPVTISVCNPEVVTPEVDLDNTRNQEISI